MLIGNDCQVVDCSPYNGFSLSNLVFLPPEKNSILKFQFDLDRGSTQKTVKVDKNDVMYILVQQKNLIYPMVLCLLELIELF